MTGLLVPTPCIHLVPHIWCIVTTSSGEHCKNIEEWKGGKKERRKERRKKGRKIKRSRLRGEAFVKTEFTGIEWRKKRVILGIHSGCGIFRTGSCILYLYIAV